ncbi:DUF4345 domain-containing protein [Acidisoma cladoniae]|jgi:hypothetical protein|uniref:DUF4345 domain-containing protein n=1 Tax=Acidisoma cladoniae TaxID=3040935 RepID=UPI00254F4EF8|nr:DUF4345 domain-containing protein [Acidisoma sp. PAMC 29798]
MRNLKLEALGFEAWALRGVVAIAGIVPVAAGLSGMIRGAAMLGGDPVANLTLDSHLRYLSGLLLAIGLGFWSTLPAIEHRTARFRLLTAIVVIGGLGRLFGILVEGLPPAPMIFGLVMELGVTPLLCLWQGRVATQTVQHG